MGNRSGMSDTGKQEYLSGARARYGRRTREGKSRLLDEVCEALGWERKHAIKALNGKRSTGSRRGRSGRKKDYGTDVAEVVALIWKSSEQPCSVRLKALLPEWLPSYEKHHGDLGKELRAKVLNASPRTLERLLEDRKCRVSGRLTDWILLFQGVLIGASVLPGLRGCNDASGDER